MTIPDYLPLLREGTGRTPKDGGCLVQVAGWLYDGHSWRDDVTCVHPVLRQAGIKVNDRVSDADRHRLAPMAARIAGSNDAVDGWPDERMRRLNVELALWAAMSVRDLALDDLRVDAALGIVEDWLAGDRTVTPDVLDAAAYAAGDAAADAAYEPPTDGFDGMVEGHLQISDCNRTVKLVFTLRSDDRAGNDLAKLACLQDAVDDFGKALRSGHRRLLRDRLEGVA